MRYFGGITPETAWFDSEYVNPLTPTVKHPVPDQVKPSFVIFTSEHSDASERQDVKNYK